MLKKKEKEEKILDVNAAMEGSLVFSDPVNLRINGKFCGTLNVKGTLIIGENAEVEADIIGENITIAGRVKGKIKASNILSLQSSANIFADIETSYLSVEKGASFNGTCRMYREKLSLTELSHFLSVNEDKILDWVKTGKIPAEKEGDNLFFDRQSVEVWLGENR